MPYSGSIHAPTLNLRCYSEFTNRLEACSVGTGPCSEWLQRPPRRRARIYSAMHVPALRRKLRLYNAHRPCPNRPRITSDHPRRSCTTTTTDWGVISTYFVAPSLVPPLQATGTRPE
jgi:hypothetical protein